jgi:ABC-type branched-subunit amino acid transport system substrate-binding protein
MKDLTGVIDLHVHAGPDVRPRKLDAVALARAAKAAGMRALLLKSHHTITADLAQIVEGVVGGIRVFGGVTLNEPVGGLNPEAVRAAIALGAKEIFMPTHSAANQRRHDRKAGGITILDDAGRLRNEVKPILALAAEADVILGTCHLSPDEILVLVREARRAGVRKVLVNHPELNSLAIPLPMQQAMASEGAFFERMHLHGNSATDLPGLAAMTRAVGVERTVLVTDLGAAAYDVDPVQGMREFLQQMATQGFSQTEIDLMARQTPARLLGLVPR